MPRAKTIGTTETFLQLQSKTITHGDRNDCSVKAVALVCGVEYEVAQQALAAAGRNKCDGAYVHQIHNAIKQLGKSLTRVDVRHFINQYPAAHRKALKSVTTHHPERFNNVWKDGKTYIAHCNNHCLAIIDGVNHDWSRGRAKRIVSIYEIN